MAVLNQELSPKILMFENLMSVLLVHSSKNVKGFFEVLLSFLNEKSQNVENRHERRLKLQEDIPRFSNP